MPKLIDIHTHLNFLDFYNGKEVKEQIKKAYDGGIWVINVGSDYESSKRAIEIAEQYDNGVFATTGLHPTDVVREVFDMEKYRELAKNPKVVAIGECGLDYFRIKSKNIEDEKIRQKKIFKKQIELAIELGKPLMIHIREAHDNVLEILTTYYSLRNNSLNGNIHFFSGNLEQAHKYIDLGFTLSFTGVITFSKDYDDVLRNVPLDKIMVETDAPFVTPVPYRGKQNEPIFVVEVAKKIAEIRGISFEDVAQVTTQNALRLFGI